MSSKDVKMTMDKIQAAFDEGDNAPDVVFSPVGRMRLVQALSRKHGSNFRNNERAMGALRAFDSELNFVQQLHAIRGK